MNGSSARCEIEAVRRLTTRSVARLALALAAASGCTPSAAPGGPTSRTAVDAPAEPEETKAPAGEAPSSKAEPTHPDCVRACARWAECAGPEHGSDCSPDCEGHLLVANPKAPASYADCLERLACEDLVASLAMNSGPAGECYTSALDAR